MKRLTKEICGYAHGAEGVSEDKLTGVYCRGEFEATAIVERLLAIEEILGDDYDLDLLNMILTAYRDGRYIVMRGAEQEGVARLRKISEADCEGRCIILPCKIGDTIYKIGYTTCKNGETHPDSYGCCGCYDECDMKECVKEFVVPSLGWMMVHYREFIEGIWYFTKDDAKAALEEMRK